MRMYSCRAGTISCSQMRSDDCRARAASRVGMAALSYHKARSVVLRRAPVPSLGRMLVRLVSDFRRAMDFSLVLDEEGIAHDLQSVQEGRWALAVDDADAARAEGALDAAAAPRAGRALAAFERKTPPVQTRSEPAQPWTSGLGAGLVLFLGLL